MILRPIEARLKLNEAENNKSFNDSDKKRITFNLVFCKSSDISHPCFQISKSKISLKILRFTPCMLDPSASALPALHDSIIKTGYIIESKKFL